MPELKGFKCWAPGFDEPYVTVAATASKARYSAWLDISDSWPELKLTDLKVKRAPASDVTFPDLPGVNENIDDRDREVILNAFGGGSHIRPEQWGYRDYQCIDPKDERMNRLVGLGVFHGPHGVDANGDTPGWCGAFWYLTDDGKDLARALIGARECN